MVIYMEDYIKKTSKIGQAGYEERTDVMEERVPPLRVYVAKRNSPSPWALFLIFLFFIGFLLILFLRSPLGEIHQVKIEGNRLITEKEIIDKTQIRLDESFFRFRSSEVQRVLTKLPEIEEVEVRKVFPSTIHIRIQERKVIALLRTTDAKIIPILDHGILLTHRTTIPMMDNPAIFEGWDEHHEEFRHVVQQFAKVEPNLQKEIAYIRPVPNHLDQTLLISRVGHKIYVRTEEMAEKMALYPSLRQQSSGSIYLLESVWFSPDS